MMSPCGDASDRPAPSHRVATQVTDQLLATAWRRKSQVTDQLRIRGLACKPPRVSHRGTRPGRGRRAGRQGARLGLRVPDEMYTLLHHSSLDTICRLFLDKRINRDSFALALVDEIDQDKMCMLLCT